MGLALIATAAWAQQSHDTLRYVRAVSDERQPHATFDGTNFLVAWHDHRRNGYFGNPWGARVSASGLVLDNAHEVANGLGHETSPDFVAFDGVNDLIGLGNDSQQVVRLAAGVLVLDDPPVPYATDGVGAARFARNSTLALVAFSSHTFGGSPLFVGTWVAGTVQYASGNTPFGTAVATGIETDNGFSIAASDTDFLVVWSALVSNVETVFFRRLDSSGNPSGPSVAIASSGQLQTAPAVVSDGSNYFVAWSEGPSNAQVVQYALVLPVGPTAPSTLGTLQSSNEGTGLSVAYDGNAYVVAWALTHNTVSLASIARMGGVITMTNLETNAADPPQPWIVGGSAAGTSLVTWVDNTGCIVGSRVQGTTRLDAASISICGTMGEAQNLPAMAHGPTADLVAWVTPTGYRLELGDAGAQDLYLGPGAGVIAVAAEPAGFLTAFDTYTTGYAQHLNAAGAPHGPPLFLTPSINDVDIVDESTGRSVMWSSNFYVDDLDASVPPGTAVWSRSVLTDGGVGPAQLRYVANEQLSDARFAGGDAGQTFVAWVNNATGTVHGVRLAAGGGSLDPAPFTLATNGEYFPGMSMTSAGNQWFVVWSNTAAVHARSVSATGVLGPDLIVANPHGNLAGFGSATAVAFDGETLLVAWLDYGSWWGDLVGTTLSLDGGLGPTLRLSTGASENRHPVAIADGPGQWAVSYEHFVTAPDIVARRAFTQTLTTEVATGVDGGSADAGSDAGFSGGDGGATSDGGSATDGGALPDGGGSSLDAGFFPDGGSASDAGTTVDGGPSPDGGPEVSASPYALGCGCHSGASQLVSLLVVLGFRRRRKLCQR